MNVFGRLGTSSECERLWNPFEVLSAVRAADIDLGPGVRSHGRSPLCSPSSDKPLLTNIWCCELQVSPFICLLHGRRPFVRGVALSTTYCLECGNLGHNAEPFSPPDVCSEDQGVSRENGMYKRLCCNINFGTEQLMMR
ncbi:hypothetical protein AVEN_123670-1 [Araneus ventricosus]|uniref:Uncharacterized protein n=1 Tax=Araneus ventricosus TaxID=182803 RepID=A0A4Y2I1W2_ARAVE|nr:hypothetical protein AVEN_243301-1 [Araneus ventricosus]GBM71601.1 hypothetical protein AVEN_123670-1 [Araneus ventricosus]